MNSRFKLSDDVLNRIVQIVQEGLLCAIDVTDLLREIEVEVSEDGAVHLTADYIALVKRSHEDMLTRLEALKEKASK